MTFPVDWARLKDRIDWSREFDFQKLGRSYTGCIVVLEKGFALRARRWFYVELLYVGLFWLGEGNFSNFPEGAGVQLYVGKAFVEVVGTYG